jgi:hypothetical protein
MSEIVTFSTEETAPDTGAILENQGIPQGLPVPAQIEELCTAACALLAKLAAPKGILKEISKAQFATVYRGEGQNDSTTPVDDIYGQAERLALFAGTLGERVSQEINNCFAANEFALGAMFDAAASISADKLTELLGERFLADPLQRGQATPATRVLGYSPGYCGWHISGQKKLFEHLRPEQIGITLRESLLMEPLKSVSGVLIAGPREIHVFQMSYPCCEKCEARSCRARIQALFAE